MREWLVEVVRRIKEIDMAVENSRVLIIVNNWGIEETELTRPLRDLKAAGAKVTLAATTLGPCETVQHDRYEGETLTPDARLSDVQAADYDLLVVPGGTCNVDRIRVNEDAITLAQEFAHEGKPIAAICHGAWLASPPRPAAISPLISRTRAAITSTSSCTWTTPTASSSSRPASPTIWTTSWAQSRMR